MLEYNKGIHGSYGYTQKARTKRWVLDNLDGAFHRTRTIGHAVEASPPMVRIAINELVVDGEILAERLGAAFTAGWRFYPND